MVDLSTTTQTPTANLNPLFNNSSNFISNVMQHQINNSIQSEPGETDHKFSVQTLMEDFQTNLKSKIFYSLIIYRGETENYS